MGVVRRGSAWEGIRKNADDRCRVGLLIELLVGGDSIDCMESNDKAAEARGRRVFVWDLIVLRAWSSAHHTALGMFSRRRLCLLLSHRQKPANGNPPTGRASGEIGCTGPERVPAVDHARAERSGQLCFTRRADLSTYISV